MCSSLYTSIIRRKLSLSEGAIILALAVGVGGIFFLLWPFSVTCYLSLGFSTKVLSMTYIV